MGTYREGEVTLVQIKNNADGYSYRAVAAFSKSARNISDGVVKSVINSHGQDLVNFGVQHELYYLLQKLGTSLGSESEQGSVNEAEEPENVFGHSDELDAGKHGFYLLKAPQIGEYVQLGRMYYPRLYVVASDRVETVTNRPNPETDQVKFFVPQVRLMTVEKCTRNALEFRCRRQYNLEAVCESEGRSVSFEVENTTTAGFFQEVKKAKIDEGVEKVGESEKPVQVRELTVLCTQQFNPIGPKMSDELNVDMFLQSGEYDCAPVSAVAAKLDRGSKRIVVKLHQRLFPSELAIGTLLRFLPTLLPLTGSYSLTFERLPDPSETKQPHKLDTLDLTAADVSRLLN